MKEFEYQGKESPERKHKCCKCSKSADGWMFDKTWWCLSCYENFGKHRRIKCK